MTFGSCSNELDVTKSFSFTVETMPVPKELSQEETIEIRYTLTCPADYSGTQYTIRYFQYDGDAYSAWEKIANHSSPMIDIQ